MLNLENINTSTKTFGFPNVIVNINKNLLNKLTFYYHPDSERVVQLQTLSSWAGLSLFPGDC